MFKLSSTMYVGFFSKEEGSIEAFDEIVQTLEPTMSKLAYSSRIWVNTFKFYVNVLILK